MSLKIAVQMDPIQRINIKGDSTFALLLEAQKRDHQLAYYTPDRLALLNGHLFANVEALSVRDQVGNYFTLGEPKRVELAGFDVVLLRQDPPFDLAYVTTTHLLERIHPKTLVVNDPAHVRNAPEKIMVTEFPDLMPKTLITRDPAGLEVDFRVRMFAPAAGIGEDPATGGAAAALGGWLGLREAPADGITRYVLAQGLEIGRPSRLEVEVEKQAGRVAAVRVGGSAVLVSEGTIEVPAAA